MALSVADGARQNRDAAGAVETNFGALIASRARLLDRVGNADAAQLAALARLRPALLEALPVGHFQRFVHALFKLAAVIDERQRGLVGQGAGRDQVLAAQFHGVKTQLVGGHVDDALDDVSRLGAPVAAIGAHPVRVGEGGGHVHMNGGRGVDASQRAQIAHRPAVRARLHIGAKVRHRLDAQRQELAVLVERQFSIRHVVATGGVGQKGFGAGGGPFHWATDDL